MLKISILEQKDVEPRKEVIRSLEVCFYEEMSAS